jgi:hypothetical protein
LAELERAGVDRIDLRRLDRRGTAALVAAVLGQPASSRVISGLFERSDGNPFHVEELLAAEASAGGMPRGCETCSMHVSRRSLNPRTASCDLPRLSAARGHRPAGRRRFLRRRRQ